MGLKIRVQNVASFQDSEQFEIKPGLNAFIGINNSGKTALLWALAMLGCAMREEKTNWALALSDKMEGYRRGNTNPAVQVEFSLPKPTRDQLIAELCQLGGGDKPLPYAEVQETFEFNLRFNRSRQVAFVDPVRVHYNNQGTRKSTEILRRNAPEPIYFIDHPFGGAKPNTWSPQKFAIQQYGADDGAPHYRFVAPDQGVAKIWPSSFEFRFSIRCQS